MKRGNPMSMYNLNDESASGGWTPTRIVGALLALAGTGVIIWTVVEIFQLFTQESAFIVLDQIVPREIIVSKNGANSLLLPRELLIFGIPIWALTVTSKIGVMMMKSGLEYVDLPARRAK
jgi:hypothetical protein